MSKFKSFKNHIWKHTLRKTPYDFWIYFYKWFVASIRYKHFVSNRVTKAMQLKKITQKNENYILKRNYLFFTRFNAEWKGNTLIFGAFMLDGFLKSFCQNVWWIRSLTQRAVFCACSQIKRKIYSLDRRLMAVTWFVKAIPISVVCL